MAGAVIEVRDLKSCFDGGYCVHDTVSFQVAPREVVAVVGGSGTGKTVLLREVIMLREPQGGSIRLFGEELVGIGERAADRLRNRFGVMFQQGALFGSLTVAQNVATPLKEHTDLPADLIEEIARTKIALVGLPPDAGNKFPRQLSGGMLKRAAVARALALDPDLLFLDEPTAGLDPLSAEGLDRLILQLRDSLGLTVMMISHDLDSLWRVADRVVFLGEKRVLAEGPIPQLTESSHPLVRDYFSRLRGREAKESA